jgi:anti-anti-sigma regulatory factor
VQDRAAPDPGGTASNGRIGSGFLFDAPGRSRTLRDRSNYLAPGSPDLPRAPPCVRASTRCNGSASRRWRSFPEHMDASSAGQIRQELLSVISGGATAVIADMSATTSCDHAGADAVVCAFQRAVTGGTELRLVVTAQHVLRVLGFSGLDRPDSIYPSPEVATRASKPEAALAVVARPKGFVAADHGGSAVRYGR